MFDCAATLLILALSGAAAPVGESSPSSTTTAGPSAAEGDVAARGPDEPAAPSEDPSEGTSAEARENDPPAEPGPVPPAETSASETAGADPEGDLSLDDIFGAPEEHTTEPAAKSDADPAPAQPQGDQGPPRPSVTGGGAGARFLSKLDMRFRVLSSVYYDIHKTDRRKFGRNENRLEFYFAYTPNEHLQIVGDIEPVFMGVSQPRELDDIATRQMITPFHVESDAAYVAINDLVPKLDVKLGRQTLVWGTADKFNPTNNINPDDLEDRPLFTEPIANQMVVVDYAPLDDKLYFQGVYVPIFYPALLPPSAAAGLKDPQTPVPFARDPDRRAIEQLQNRLELSPGLVPTVTANVVMPKHRFVDGQSAIKLGTSLGGVDMSVSYYNGRHDIPTPVRVDSAQKVPAVGPVDEAECCYSSNVQLVYPRMQVIGFDFATQLSFLRDLGLWGEGALFFPTARDLYIEFPISVDVTPDDGTANPVDSLSGPNVLSTPFVKATAGFDYTFGKHVYVQLQYLRGFIDEFGARQIGNYVVGGSDLIFFGRHFVFRAFGLVELPSNRPGSTGSYVIYPELMLTPPWGSVTLHLGSFFLLGKDDTKFGQSATGSSIVFGKVVGTF